MMTMLKWNWLAVGLAGILFANSCVFGETIPNEKAQRYFSVLKKRPLSETLFDRFFDAWLETATIEECETFLKQQSVNSASEKLISGRFYLRRGNQQSAAESFRDVTTSEAASPQHQAGAWLQLAIISGSTREFEDGLTNLENAEAAFLKADSWNVKTETQVVQLRGTFLIRAGKRDEALTAWTALLDKRGGDDLLREDLVTLLANEGIWDKAIEQQVILIKNTEGKPYDQVLQKIGLGQLYRRSGRWNEALQTWRSTLPKVGHDTWIERELIGLISSFYRRNSDLKGWKTELNSLISAEPKRIALKVEQAALLAELREDGPAIEAWEAILALTPGNRELRLQFARTLARLKRPADAAAQLAKLVETAPDDSELRFELSTLYHEAGNTEATRAQLNAFLEKSDGSEYSILRAARQFSRYEMPKDAETVFEKLVAKFPESSSAENAFATFLFDNGKKEAAIARWKNLAQSGDASLLVQTAKQLSNRDETESAYAILEARLPEFPGDRNVLELICDLAIATNRAADATNWAVQLVHESDNITMLENSILLTGQVAKATGETGVSDLISKLERDETQSIKMRCLIGDLHRQLGNSTDAILVLEKATTAARGTGDEKFPLSTLAAVWRRVDDFSKAAATMEQIVALDGGLTTANLQQLVRDHKRAEAPEQALKWVGEWRKFAPGNQLTWLEEADLLNRLGRISESLELLRGAARRFENESTVLMKLADAYNATGFPLEAERTLWRLYESTDDPWKRRGMIDRIMQAAEQGGRQKEIVARFEERHQNNSQAVEPLLALASVYRQLGRPDDQREALLKAGRIAPENLQLVHQIASLDEKEGRVDSAIRILTGALERDKTPRTTEFIARLHLQNGDLEKAIAIYDSMPDGGRYATPENIVGMGQALMFIGEWKLAAEFLEPKLKLHPQDGAMHYLHALALRESGRNEAAVAAFKNLLNFEMPQTPAPVIVNPHSFNHYLSPQNALEQLVAKYRTQYQALSRAVSYRTPIGDGSVWAFSNYSGSQFRSAIQIPANATELHSFAFAHLLSVQVEVENDLLARTSLKPWEIDFAKLALSSGNQSAFEFYERWIDEPEVALLYITRTIAAPLEPAPTRDSSHQMNTQTEALSERAFSVIKANYDSEVQFFAASYLASNVGTLRKEWRQTLINLAEQLETISSAAAQVLIRNAMTRPETGKPGSELVQVDQRFSNLLITFLTPTEDEKFNAINGSLKSSIISVLMRGGATDAWTSSVIREQRNYEKTKLKTAVLNPQSFDHQQAKFYHGISPSLPNFRFREHRGEISGAEVDLAAEIRKGISKLGGNENRLLRLYFSQLDEALHNRVLAEIEADVEKGNEPSIYEWLALAANHPKEEDTDKFPTTVARLTRAQQSPDASPETQHAIDYLLVNLIATQEPTPELRKQGVEAGWRYLKADKISLGSSPWEVSERLKSWGEPADDIQKALAKFTVRQQAKMAQQSVSRRAPYQNQRRAPVAANNLMLQQMLNLQPLHHRIQSNPTQANATLVAKRLQLFAPGILVSPNNSFEQQFDHLTEKITQNNLTETTLESIRPEPDARPLDRIRFASLLDLFGKKNEALASYEKLIAEFPEDDGLRKRRIHLISFLRTDELISELKKYAANPRTEASDLNQVVLFLASLQFNKDMKSRLDVAEQLIGFLAEQPTELAASQGYQNPISRLQNSIGSQFYDDRNVAYRSISGRLNDPFGNTNSKLPEAPSELAQYKANDARRLKLFIEVCKMGLDDPYLASSSFQQIAAAIEPGETNDEITYQNCQRALATILKSSSESTQTSLTPLWGNARPPERDFSTAVPGWKTKATPASAPAPVPWLIEYAFRTNQQGLIDESTLLDRGNFIRDQVNAIRALYFCEPEKINETVKQSRELAGNFRAFTTYIQRALSLRPEADKHFNPDPIIFEELSGPNRANAQKMATIRISQLAMTRGPKETLAYLEKIFEAANGMSEQEEANFMSAINTSSGCSGILMKFVHNNGFAAKHRFMPYDINRFNNTQSNDPNLLYIGLRNFGAFEDLETFDTLPTSGFQQLGKGLNERSFLAIQVKKLQRWMDYRDNKNQIPQLISRINESDTFGAQVIAASLSETPANAVLTVFDEHATALEKLTPERQIQISSFAADLLDLRRLNTQLTTDQRNTLRWIIRNSAQAEIKKLESYATAKKIGDLGIAPENLLSEVSRNLQTGLVFDIDKTRLAFENISILGEAAVAEGSIQRHRESFTSNLLISTLNNIAQADSFAFAISLLQSETLPPFFQQDSRIAQSATTILRKAKSPEDRLDIFKVWTEQVYAELDLSSNLSVTVTPLYEIIRGQEAEFPPLVLEWTRGRDGIGLYPELAPHIELAAMLNLRSNDHPDEWCAAIDRLSELIEAKDLSDSARANLASLVCRLDSYRVGGPLSKKGVEQLLVLWKKHGQNVDPYFENQAINTIFEQRIANHRIAYQWDDWKPISEQIVSSFSGTYLKTQSEKLRIERNAMQSDKISKVLTLTLESGQLAQAQQILTTWEEQLNSHINIFYELVRNDADELAGQMLRKEWKTMLQENRSLPYFDRELGYRVESFCDGLETDQEWLRWVGRFLLVQGRDVSSRHRQYAQAIGWPEDDQRILAASKLLPVDDFPDSESLRLVLAKIGEIPEAIALHSEALARSAEGITISQIEAEKDSNVKRSLTGIFRVKVKNALAENDLSVLEVAVKEAKLLPEIRDQIRWSGVLQKCVSDTLDSKKQISDEAFNKLISLALSLQTQGNSRSTSNVLLEKIIEHSIIHFLVDGNQSRLKNRFSNLDENTQEQIAKVWKDRNYQIKSVIRRKLSDRRSNAGLISDAEGSFFPLVRKTQELRASDLGLKSFVEIQIGRFLKAENVAAIEADQKKFQTNLVNLIRDYNVTTSQRRAVIDKATSLINSELGSSNGWHKNFDNGWHARSEILQNYMMRSSPQASDIKLYVDLLWNETPPDLSISWSHKYGQQLRADRMWSSAKRRTDGEKDELKIFEKLLLEFRKELPENEADWGNIEALRPILYETCRLWTDRPNDLANIVNHIDENLSDDPLAYEFGLAARTWWASFWTPPVVDIQEPDRWATAALKSLNGELSPNTRSMLHCFYLYRPERNCPPELRRKITTDAAELLNTDTAINGHEIAMILNFFRDFKRDDTWKETAQRYLDGWNYRNRFRGKPASEGINFKPNAAATTSMLQLVLELGDPGKTATFIKTYQPEIEIAPLAVPVLIRGGEHKLAAEILNKSIEKITPVNGKQANYVSTHHVYYDAKMHRELPVFLESLPTTELKFFTELVVASAPNPEYALEETFSETTRIERLKKVAARFSNTEFSNAEHQQRALYLLSQNWQLAETLDSPLSENFSTTRIEEIPTTGNQSTILDPLLQPLITYAVGKIHSESDPETFKKLTNRLSMTSASPTSWNRHHTLSQLGYGFRDLLYTDFSSMNKAQKRATFDALGEFIKSITDHKNYWSYQYSYLFQSILADELNARDELDQFREGLPSSQKEKLKEAFKTAQNQGFTVLRSMYRGHPEKIESAGKKLQSDPWWVVPEQ